MARKGKDEEKLLSFAPKRRQDDDNIDDWEFLDDDEEEELEELPPIVEEEEEEEVVEPEVVEELELDDDLGVEEVEEPVEEVVEEPVEEEVVEEVDLGDLEVEDVVEELEVEEPEVEEVVEEVAEAPVEEIDLGPVEVETVDDTVESDYDRTNIFEHATVYYDQNTTILPRNFESRIRMSDDGVKKIYSDIKNVLMEYSGVKSRMLKYVEVFRCGGAVAKMRIKGKSLYLYLRLDPACVDQDYLKVVDKSERRGYEETPAEIKVTGKRKCKRSIEMIRVMMDALGVGHRRHPEVVDYAAKYPTLENAVILGKNMVKVNKRSDYEK